MTKQQFNKEVKSIFKEYNVKNNTVQTSFGKLRVRLDKVDNNRLYSLFMKFEDDFDINLFYKHFSEYEVINPHTKKWNLHSQDPEYILTELDERLSNLAYILREHGKYDFKEYEPLFN